MKIGMLEYRDDKFIQDLMSKLPGSEFVKFSNMEMPVDRDFDVVVDRLSFHNKFLNSVVRQYSMAGVYVINNPFAVACTNKVLQLQVCKKLKIPYPKTVLLPSKVEGYDFKDVMGDAGFDYKYPAVLKPYDGFAWEDVYVVNSAEEAQKIYKAVSGRRVMIFQEFVEYEEYLRCFCIGDKTLITRYDPKARKCVQHGLRHLDHLKPQLEAWMRDFNDEIDFDINTIEWAVKGNKVCMIDAYNEVPDILPHELPHDYYWWLVDSFAECVRSKENQVNKFIRSH
jgi:hypothetical protein